MSLRRDTYGKFKTKKRKEANYSAWSHFLQASAAGITAGILFHKYSMNDILSKFLDESGIRTNNTLLHSRHIFDEMDIRRRSYISLSRVFRDMKYKQIIDRLTDEIREYERELSILDEMAAINNKNGGLDISVKSFMRSQTSVSSLYTDKEQIIQNLKEKKLAFEKFIVELSKDPDNRTILESLPQASKVLEVYLTPDQMKKFTNPQLINLTEGGLFPHVNVMNNMVESLAKIATKNNAYDKVDAFMESWSKKESEKWHSRLSDKISKGLIAAGITDVNTMRTIEKSLDNIVKNVVASSASITARKKLTGFDANIILLDNNPFLSFSISVSGMRPLKINIPLPKDGVIRRESGASYIDYKTVIPTGKVQTSFQKIMASLEGSIPHMMRDLFHGNENSEINIIGRLQREIDSILDVTLYIGDTNGAPLPYYKERITSSIAQKVFGSERNKSREKLARVLSNISTTGEKTRYSVSIDTEFFDRSAIKGTEAMKSSSELYSIAITVFDNKTHQKVDKYSKIFTINISDRVSEKEFKTFLSKIYAFDEESINSIWNGIKNGSTKADVKKALTAYVKDLVLSLGNDFNIVGKNYLRADAYTITRNLGLTPGTEAYKFIYAEMGKGLLDVQDVYKFLFDTGIGNRMEDIIRKLKEYNIDILKEAKIFTREVEHTAYADTVITWLVGQHLKSIAAGLPPEQKEIIDKALEIVNLQKSSKFISPDLKLMFNKLVQQSFSNSVLPSANTFGKGASSKILNHLINIRPGLPNWSKQLYQTFNGVQIDKDSYTRFKSYFSKQLKIFDKLRETVNNPYSIELGLITQAQKDIEEIAPGIVFNMPIFTAWNNSLGREGILHVNKTMQEFLKMRTTINKTYKIAGKLPRELQKYFQYFDIATNIATKAGVKKKDLLKATERLIPFVDMSDTLMNYLRLRSKERRGFALSKIEEASLKRGKQLWDHVVNRVGPDDEILSNEVAELLNFFNEVKPDQFGNLHVSHKVYNDKLLSLVEILRKSLSLNELPDNRIPSWYPNYSNLNIANAGEYGLKQMRNKIWRIKFASRGFGSIGIIFELFGDIEKFSTFLKGQTNIKKDIPDYIIGFNKFDKNGDFGQFIKQTIDDVEMRLLESGKKEEVASFIKDIMVYFNNVHKSILEDDASGKLKKLFEGENLPYTTKKGLQLIQNLPFKSIEERAAYLELFYKKMLEKHSGLFGLGEDLENIIAKYSNIYNSGDVESARRFVIQEASIITGKKNLELREALQIVKKNIRNESFLKMLKPYFEILENPGKYTSDDLKKIPNIISFLKAGNEILIGQRTIGPLSVSTLGIDKNFDFMVKIPFNFMLFQGGTRPQWIEDMIGSFINWDKLDVLKDMSSGFSLNSNTIPELAKNGQAAIIGLQDISKVLGDFKNVLSGRLHISRKLLDESETIDEAIAKALDNPGEFMSARAKEGFERVDRLILNRTLFAKIYDKFMEMFREKGVKEGQMLYLDLGENFNFTREFLENHNFTSSQIDAIQKELANGSLRFLPIPTRIIKDKELYSVTFGQAEYVVPHPIMGGFLKTVRDVLNFIENSVVTKQNRDLKDKVLKSMFGYLDVFGKSLFGKEGILGRTLTPRVPGFIGVGLPTTLLNSQKPIASSTFELFSSTVHPDVINQLKDYFKMGGYTDKEIGNIMRGKLNLLGVAGRNPIVQSLSWVLGITNVSEAAKPDRVYVDPLTSIILQFGDWDADLYGSLFNLSKGRDVKDIFDAYKSLYGVSDADLNMWNLYGKISNGKASPKAYKELADLLGIESPANFKDKKLKKKFLEEVNRAIKEKNSSISVKIKKHIEDMVGEDILKDKLDLLGIKVSSKSNIFAVGGQKIYLPKIIGRTGTNYEDYGKAYEKFLDRLGAISEVTGEKFIDMVERIHKMMHGAEGYPGEIYQNIFGKMNVGQLHNHLMSAHLLISKINTCLDQGLSNNEIRANIGNYLTDDLINSYRKISEEYMGKRDKISYLIGRVYDMSLKGKRGKTANVIEAFEIARGYAEGHDIHDLLKNNELMKKLFVDSGIAQQTEDGLVNIKDDVSRLALKLLGLSYNQYNRELFGITSKNVSTGAGVTRLFERVNIQNAVNPGGITGMVLDLINPKIHRSTDLFDTATDLFNKGHFIAGSMKYLADHIDKRILKGFGLVAAISIGGFLFTPHPFHGDVFSLGFDIGHVTGTDPSMYDGRWVPPELPREIPISADTTNFNKKAYIIKRMMDTDPSVYTQLRRSGAIYASDSFNPKYDRSRRRAYSTLKFRI